MGNSLNHDSELVELWITFDWVAIFLDKDKAPFTVVVL